MAPIVLMSLWSWTFETSSIVYHLPEDRGKWGSLLPSVASAQYYSSDLEHSKMGYVLATVMSHETSVGQAVLYYKPLSGRWRCKALYGLAELFNGSNS